MNLASASTDSGSTSAQRSLVAFRLGQHTYALPIEPIVRIIPMVTITSVPQVSDVVEGIINVHGAAIPVVNLCRHLGLPETPLQLYTPIVLIHIGKQMVGLIVDEMTNVLSLPSDRIVRSADILPEELHDTPILEGLAHVPDGMVLMLDPDHLFRPDQVEALVQAVRFLDKLLAEGVLEAWPVQTQPQPARTRRKKRQRPQEGLGRSAPG